MLREDVDGPHRDQGDPCSSHERPVAVDLTGDLADDPRMSLTVRVSRRKALQISAYLTESVKVRNAKRRRETLRLMAVRTACSPSTRTTQCNCMCLWQNGEQLTYGSWPISSCRDALNEVILSITLPTRPTSSTWPPTMSGSLSSPSICATAKFKRSTATCGEREHPTLKPSCWRHAARPNTRYPSVRTVGRVQGGPRAPARRQ